MLFFLPALVASLIVRFHRASGLEGQQLKLLLYAVALSATATTLNTTGVRGVGRGHRQPHRLGHPNRHRDRALCAIGCTTSTG